jgi:hypothetical protein
MAYCKTIVQKIKSESYLSNSLAYITNPNKVSQVTFITENIVIPDTDVISIENAYRITRNLANKNNKILAHHFVQSFGDYDNVTPELAHQIGLEFIKNNLSKYQVTLATHIDGGHIHNHFIINSVSPVDGLKFKDNKNSINALRQASDDLCVKYGLSIIDKGTQSKYDVLDNATIQCAKKGTSWKVQLVKDLDEAFENCKTKNDFIDFMKNKNYEIRWANKNITFRKQGVNKGIRADTLAKQFGNKYSKASIEYKLNIPIQTVKECSRKEISTFEYNRYQLNKFAVSEWRRQERIKRKNTFPYSYENNFSKVLFAKSPLDFTIRLICYMFMSSKQKQCARYSRREDPCTYKVKSYCDIQNKKQFVRNVNYNTLINSAGNTVQLKMYSWQLAKLLDNNVLFTSKVDLTSGTALITVKEFDVERISKILNVPYETLQTQSNQINNRKVKYHIAKDKGKTEYLVIPKELFDNLNQYKNIEFSYRFRHKDKKYLISFDSKNKHQILSILFPNRSEQNKDGFYIKNVKLNKQLKQIAKDTNQKVCYKIVVNSQYKKLKDTDINFAVFLQKDGKYNIVYLENDKQKVNKILGGDKKTNNPTNREKNNLKL